MRQSGSIIGSGRQTHESQKALLFTTTVAFTADEFLEELATSVRDLGWTVDLACNLGDLKGQTRPYRRVFDMPWSRGFSSPSRIVRSALEIRRIVRENGYDLVHTHTPTASAVVRITVRTLRRRPRVIYTAHGFHFGQTMRAYDSNVARTIETVLLPLTDFIVVINDDDEEWARKRAKSRTTVIRTQGVGVRDAFYDLQANSTKCLIRKTLGIAGDRFVVTTIGRLERGKHVGSVIDVVTSMPDAEQFDLLIVGDGPERESLKRKALDAEELRPGLRIHLLGHRSDVSRLLHATDVLVHASEREGLPTVVLESMATGTPVVAYDIRGCREALRKGGGVLVAPGDTAGLAEAVAGLHADPRFAADVGSRGRGAAMNFRRSVVVQDLCALYRDALSVGA